MLPDIAMPAERLDTARQGWLHTEVRYPTGAPLGNANSVAGVL